MVTAGSDPHHFHWQKLEERLDRSLQGLVPVRENRMCWIYQARHDGVPVIVKQYKRHCREGAGREARALGVYGRACLRVPELLPSRLIAVNETSGTLAVSFIEGELLSTVLKRSPKGATREALGESMFSLGRLLATFRDLTQEPRGASSFIEEYLLYTSQKLAAAPLLGTLLFRRFPSEALSLFSDYCHANERASLSHGDLVFANMIFDGSRVGLIDFANANFESHTLDDVYTFRVTCDSLLHLSSSAREMLQCALREGLAPLEFDERVHRFFWEYHRRRWLAINLRGGLKNWAQFVLCLPRMLAGPPEPATRVVLA